MGRIGIGKLKVFEGVESGACGLECRPAANGQFPPLYDSRGEDAVGAFPDGGRNGGHHDWGGTGIPNHLGMLDAVEEGHGIGPPGRLPHLPGLDAVAFQQCREMDLGFFTPAGTGRGND
jgi:hypothetical protein